MELQRTAGNAAVVKEGKLDGLVDSFMTMLAGAVK